MVHAYKDKAKSIQERADDLLSRMTLDEKIDQMHVMHVANYSRDRLYGNANAEDIRGSICGYKT